MSEGRCGVERLERRALLAAVPAGPDFPLDDGGTGGYAPAVAMNSRGDFVAAWYEYGAAAGDADVYARRFDASGVPQGEAFRVNTSTPGIQGDPSVAIDDAGDFVISWTSGGPYAGTQGYDVYARRYDAAGNPQGDGFRVNTTTQGDQGSSGVAIDQDGDFVITWASNGSEGVNTIRGIVAQRYDSSGARRG